MAPQEYFWIPAGLLPALLALLPLAIVAVSMGWRSRAWSTREVPGAVFRLFVGALFAACVVPAWGLLAAQASAWWWVRGWVIRSGGLLWPTAAAVLYVGLQAPRQAVDAGIVLALAMGVVQSALAFSQWKHWPIFLVPGEIFGTIGHRTGLGIYLGMLMVMATQIGGTTPPVAVCLFVGTSIAGCPYDETIRRCWPFIAALLLALLAVFLWPPLATWIPNTFLK